MNLSKFDEELKSINPNIKLFLADFPVPEYFWVIPASTSYKYHPEYTLGVGGLVLHTKAAIKIAQSLFPLYKFEKIEEDIIVGSLLLHDTYKCGTDDDYLKDSKTKFNHPLLVSREILKFELSSYRENFPWWITSISNCVASHMGQWNTSDYSYEILPVPSNPLQNFVHLCDYLASRQFITVSL